MVTPESNIPKINFESGGYIVFGSASILIGIFYLVCRTGLGAYFLMRWYKKRNLNGEENTKLNNILNVLHYVETTLTMLLSICICNLIIPISMFDRSSILIAFFCIPLIHLFFYIDAIRLRTSSYVGDHIPMYELSTPLSYCVTTCMGKTPSTAKRFQHHLSTHSSPKKGAVSTIKMAIYRYIYGIQLRGLTCLWVWTFCVFYSLLMAFMFQGACICMKPDEVTTRPTRVYAKSYCYSTSYCAFYSVLPEKPHSEAILMHYSSVKPTSSKVYYDTQSRDNLDAYAFQASCRFQAIPGLELDGGRYVHTCDLSNLNASTTYYFTFNYVDDQEKNHELDTIYTYRTLIPPTSTSRNVNYILGGDRATGSTDVEKLYTHAFSYVNKEEIDFIAIGGDVVYANAFPTCFIRYDMLFEEYRRVTMDLNKRLIPLLTVLGNHESFSIGFGVDISLIRNYKYYFTHRIGDEGTSKSSFYHEHHLGQHSLMLGLDSHVVNPHADQNNFIKASFNAAINTDARYQFFSMYHAPLYPSYRAVNGSEAVSGRQEWDAIFSQYNLSLAFENHDHLFKRTKPIYNGQVLNHVSPSSSHGVVYVGDGAFGVGRKAKTIEEVKHERPFLDKIESEYHVYLVTINATHNTLRAINPEGTLVDHFVRERRAS